MVKFKILSNLDFDEKFAGNREYLGTFSKDLLKKVSIPLKTVSYAVINMEDSLAGQGTHWVAMFNSPLNKHIYYFDSYGVAPAEEVIKWLRKSRKQILYNTTQIQHIDSIACGHYCLAFIYNSLSKNDYLDFVNQFDQAGTLTNDLIVKKLLTG